MSTVFLSRNEIRRLINMSDVIEAVEDAFKSWSGGLGAMPSKAYLTLEEGDFRAMPSALPGCVAVKWANVHPLNPSRGLPTVMAILIYSDPETGYPLAVMDATEITAYRTGATAAIASRYLARKDSCTIGIVGVGEQAYTQLLAHLQLFEIISIKVFDRSSAAIDKFIQYFNEYPVQSCSLQNTIASDILCTLTPSRQPFVKKEWVLKGTHINAVGADAKGKQELETALLKEAVIVVDDLDQATASGEINVPLSSGLLRIDDIHATLCEIISGKKKGRVNDEQITVFDSTGLAIEDVAVAHLIYRKAKDKGDYLNLDFVDG